MSLPAREISGIAWYDKNTDGKLNVADGDEVLSGVKATLYKYDETAKEYKAVAGKTVTTGTDGSYKFTDLPEGKYKVVFDNDDQKVTTKASAPAADNSITKNVKDGSKLVAETGEITLPSDKAIIDSTIPEVDGVKTYKVLNQNSGYVPTVSRTVEGIAWLDTNKDGKIDASETKFSGVTVKLVDKDGKEIAKTTTGTDGSYKFVDVPAGDYTIVIEKDMDVTVKANDNLADGNTTDGKRYAEIGNVSLPTDAEIVAKADTDSHITQNGHSYTYALKDQDAGFVNPAVKRVVEGTVWLDEDKDGTRETGEELLSGKTVNLVDPTTGDVIKTTTTDENGGYKFDDVPAGTFDIVVVEDRDTTVKSDDNLADPDKGSDDKRTGVIKTVTLPTDDEIIADTTIPEVNSVKTYTKTKQDAGFVDPEVERVVEGTVWLDKDRDGSIDSEDELLGGKTVELVDKDGKVIKTTTTDDKGYYKFEDVPAGKYDIVVSEDRDTTVKKNDNLADPDKGSDGKRTGVIKTVELPTDKEIIADKSIPEKDGKKTYTKSEQNAGFVDPKVERTVEGTAWVDKDKDGTIDKDEKVLTGTTVKLVDPEGKTVMTTTTDDDGHYKFTDVPPGTYDIVVVEDRDITVKDGDNKADTDKNSDGTKVGVIKTVTLPTDEEILTDSSIPEVNGSKVFSIEDQNAGFVPLPEEETPEEPTPEDPDEEDPDEEDPDEEDPEDDDPTDYESVATPDDATPKDATVTTPAKTVTTNKIKTGDPISLALFAGMAVISLLGMIAVVIFRKREDD